MNGIGFCDHLKCTGFCPVFFYREFAEETRRLKSAFPCFCTLQLLKNRWIGLDHDWGPGGSVGFELATGKPIAKAESELDIVLYAERRVPVDEAKGAIEVPVSSTACDAASFGQSCNPLRPGDVTAWRGVLTTVNSSAIAKLFFQNGGWTKGGPELPGRHERPDHPLFMLPLDPSFSGIREDRHLLCPPAWCTSRAARPGRPSRWSS